MLQVTRSGRPQSPPMGDATAWFLPLAVSWTAWHEVAPLARLTELSCQILAPSQIASFERSAYVVRFTGSATHAGPRRLVVESLRCLLFAVNPFANAPSIRILRLRLGRSAIVRVLRTIRNLPPEPRRTAPITPTALHNAATDRRVTPSNSAVCCVVSSTGSAGSSRRMWASIGSDLAKPPDCPNPSRRRPRDDRRHATRSLGR